MISISLFKVAIRMSFNLGLLTSFELAVPGSQDWTQWTVICPTPTTILLCNPENTIESRNVLSRNVFIWIYRHSPIIVPPWCFVRRRSEDILQTEFEVTSSRPSHFQPRLPLNLVSLRRQCFLLDDATNRCFRSWGKTLDEWLTGGSPLL